MEHLINTDRLTIAKVQAVVESKATLALSDSAKERITKCREYLDKRLAKGEDIIYGVNTGFGALCNTIIPFEELSKLQANLVRSHACGVGEEVPTEIVKLMMFLKVQGFSYGHSAIRLETAQRLLDFYNNDITPVVYQQGSLGASGDLAPLAHMSLALLGDGEVDVNGQRMAAAEMLKKFGWEPLVLESKEGLALLNGTQFMSAYGMWSLIKANQLYNAVNKVACVSLDGFECRINPFFSNVNEVRQQKGQIHTASEIRSLLEGSEMMAIEKEHVQDPYSFRCIPQVHGASKDVIDHVSNVFENEINAVTDNPTIFPDTDEVISAGNFHGQPLAISLDMLGIALAELGNISERRTYQLISGTRGLPAFLVANPGINSGLMIPQYTAASVVSQNKQLASPASVDSIESSNGQEDHVSMGANAATKCYLIVRNLEKIIGIELLNAAQAIEFRRPLKTSPQLEEILSAYRAEVPFIEEDKYLHPEIEKSITFIANL